MNDQAALAGDGALDQLHPALEHERGAGDALIVGVLRSAANRNRQFQSLFDTQLLFIAELADRFAGNEFHRKFVAVGKDDSRVGREFRQGHVIEGQGQTIGREEPRPEATAARSIVVDRPVIRVDGVGIATGESKLTQ